MATKIDLTKDLLTQAINVKLASLKRAANTTTNQLMRNIINDEINTYQAALITIAETK